MSAIPAFLDFEASSLSDKSYPIEVAWNDAQGVIESHLISPAGVRRWTEWSDRAEEIHGISRAELIQEGESPEAVCARLLPVLMSGDVYSDAPSIDGEWLAKLFEAGRVKLPAGFKLRDYREHSCIHTLQPEEWIACQAAARQTVNGHHRASVDVWYLMEVYRFAKRINPLR